MISANQLGFLTKNELISIICDYQEAVQKEVDISFEDFYNSSTLISRQSFEGLRKGDIIYDSGCPVTVVGDPYINEDADDYQTWEVDTEPNGVLCLGEVYSAPEKYIFTPSVFAKIRWQYGDVESLLISKGMSEEKARIEARSIILNPKVLHERSVEEGWQILEDLIDLENPDLYSNLAANKKK